MKELNAKFDHIAVEKGRYQEWLDNDLFKADVNSSKKPYSIILPPPNVTGKLHLGHAWDGTLQDILIRYKHMQGYETMWIPGMDHAGIATQAKVDQRLQEMGTNRFELGREKFLDQAWAWKDEYANIIHQQWAKMGFALDYSQEKFTLDIDVNKKVNEVFVKLYDKGLIYQGYKITNWDPHAKTAISDIEVIYKEQQGFLYYLKYYLEDSSDFLEVATTRPETIFGDQAICVHPEDERYQKYIGKKVIIPGLNRIIPIIADEYVEPEFGTGIVKITPAHDPNDYEVGLRHDLDMPIIMNLDGTMNDICGEYQGLDRFECRSQLIKDLDNTNLVSKIEDYTHNVGFSERSDVVVETILSKQWFVKMDSLAKQAIEFQKQQDHVNFYPQRFEQTFINWMENIQDWCISRQLWWGHRIPAWYHKDTGEVYVGIEPPQDIDNYIQDEDVLDTWFSSALWPMATTIWRDNPIDKFYPTQVLVTGYDIIFFWVSRMIFQAIEFSGQKPFDDVLIHGLIRAEDGRKMSKSLGNGIDPMDVVENKGADALRLFLVSNSAPGLDLRYSNEKLDASWNFLNKVWNVSRFIIGNCNNEVEDIKLNLLDDADLYIIQEFNTTLEKINYYMDKYEFGEATRYLIHFIKDEFSSWYLESVKIYFNKEDNISCNKKNILYTLLLNSLKLLHPFAPFITDEIYNHLTNDVSLLTTQWPNKFDIDTKAGHNRFLLVKEIIIAIRNFREQNNITVKKQISIIINNTNIDIHNNFEIIKTLANVECIYDEIDNREVVSFVFKDGQMHIINEGLIDTEMQNKKLELQKEKILNEIRRNIKILSNNNFISKADPNKVEEEINKANNNVEQYYETLKLLNSNDVDQDVLILEGVIKKL